MDIHAHVYMYASGGNPPELCFPPPLICLPVEPDRPLMAVFLVDALKIPAVPHCQLGTRVNPTIACPESLAAEANMNAVQAELSIIEVLS